MILVSLVDDLCAKPIDHSSLAQAIAVRAPQMEELLKHTYMALPKNSDVLSSSRYGQRKPSW